MRAKEKHITDDISQFCHVCVCSYIPCHQYVDARRFLIGYMLECVSLSPDTLRPDTLWPICCCCCCFLLWRFVCVCLRTGVYTIAICMFGCALKRRSVQPSQLYAYYYSWIDVTSSVRLSLSLCFCLFSRLTVSKTFS